MQNFVKNLQADFESLPKKLLSKWCYFLVQCVINDDIIVILLTMIAVPML